MVARPVQETSRFEDARRVLRDTAYDFPVVTMDTPAQLLVRVIPGLPPPLLLGLDFDHILTPDILLKSRLRLRLGREPGPPGVSDRQCDLAGGPRASHER